MRNVASCCAVLLLAMCAAAARADDAPADSPAAAPAADLKFRDFFTLPIGPTGLAPSARLLSLAGQRVRIVGYMARQEQPAAGIVILASLPVVLGDEDESYADDLPAATLYVHLAEAEHARTVAYVPGLVSFTGVLQLGAASEADGRVSFVRLLLAAEPSRALATAR